MKISAETKKTTLGVVATILVLILVVEAIPVFFHYTFRWWAWWAAV